MTGPRTGTPQRTSRARKRGRCATCNGWILIGDPITRRGPNKPWRHADCPTWPTTNGQ